MSGSRYKTSMPNSKIHFLISHPPAPVIHPSVSASFPKYKTPALLFPRFPLSFSFSTTFRRYSRCGHTISVASHFFLWCLLISVSQFCFLLELPHDTNLRYGTSARISDRDDSSRCQSASSWCHCTDRVEDDNISKDNMEEFFTAIGRYKLGMLNDYNPVYDEDLRFCGKIMRDIVYQYVYGSMFTSDDGWQRSNTDAENGMWSYGRC